MPRLRYSIPLLCRTQPCQSMPSLCYSLPLLCSSMPSLRYAFLAFASPCGADFVLPLRHSSSQCYSFAPPCQSMRNHSVAVLGISILFTAYPLHTRPVQASPLRHITNLTLLFLRRSLLCLDLPMRSIALQSTTLPLLHSAVHSLPFPIHA